MFEKKEIYNFKKKSVIKIHGSDKFSFIQGIISNDIELLKKKNSIYSSILSPQGRFISDFFLFVFKNSLLMEIYEDDQELILQKLNMYKLRSNIEITLLKEVKIFLVSNHFDYFTEQISNNNFIFSDPRFPNLFKRLYLFEDFDVEFLKNLKNLSDNEYFDLRIQNSIPDFRVDAIKNKSLLMEMRFDELNGISWEKGCYMGQEITARMKYRNLMKQKIFKIKIKFNSFLDKEIKINETIVGIITSHNKKSGFAYLNLKQLNSIENNTLLSGDCEIKIDNLWWSKH